jgi:hypothetical protein
MLEICLVMIVVILVGALCMHHHTMKTKLYRTGDEDAEIVRIAAEHSIMASNTVNPILALVEVTRAVQLLESLHKRYGVDGTNDITKVDTRDMLVIVLDQKERILQDVMSDSRMLPKHPLNEHAGFIRAEDLP